MTKSLKLNEEIIRASLEDNFGLPMKVVEKIKNGNPTYSVSPEQSESGLELFSIEAEIVRDIRLHLKFIPDKFAANFIRSMGERKPEQKNIFLRLLKTITDQGATCTALVNHYPLDKEDITLWPDEWKKIRLEMNIHLDDDRNRENDTELFIKWLGLFMSLVLSLTETEDDFIDNPNESFGEEEGRSIKTTVNKYERSRKNRAICLAINGYACSVCGMDFEKVYGELGKGYIHVHHIVPLSEMNGSYTLDPGKDLIPICPNCHSMIHRKKTPLSPDELKSIINTKKD